MPDSIVLQKPHQRAELLVALDLLLIEQSRLADADRFDGEALSSDEALWEAPFLSPGSASNVTAIMGRLLSTSAIDT